MYSNSLNPMSRWPEDELEDPSLSSERMESDGTGGEVRVTRFSDGSAITHFGGPCGSLHTDANGDEC